MNTHIKLERKDEVGNLILFAEDQSKPPTIDFNVLNELETRIREIRSDIESYRAVIIQSEHPKYFIVGANLEALKQLTKDSIREWVRRGHEVFNALENLPLPVIAKVKGYGLGGGLELALACDFIFCSNNAFLGQPEVNLGFVTGWGGSFRLPRRIGIAKAKDLIFTGKIIDADQAYNMDLIDFVGNEEELDLFINETIANIKKNSSIAIGMVKKLIQNSVLNNGDMSCYEEAVASSVCISSGDTQERLADFFQKKKKK